MKDPIAKAYLLHKTPIVPEKLPSILCGKYDDDDVLTEELHYDDDPYDAAEFHAKLADVHMKTLDHAATDEELSAHVAMVKDVLAGTKGRLPDHTDIEKIRKITSDIPFSKFHHFSSVLGHVAGYAAKKTPEPVSGDLVFMQPHEIQHALSQALVPLNGRMFRNDMGTTYHYVHPNGNIYPAQHGTKYMVTPYADANQEHINELTETHGDVLEPYSYMLKHYTDDSKEINSTLAHMYHGTTPETSMWKHPPEVNHEISKDLSKVINKAPALNDDIDVFTGISARTDVYGKTMNGTQGIRFHAPTFTSTSPQFGVASSFAKPKPTGTTEVGHNTRIADVLHIKLPKGFKGGAYVEKHTSNKGEHEYLIDKGHDISVEPSPKYLTGNNKVIRVWKATVHPK